MTAGLLTEVHFLLIKWLGISFNSSSRNVTHSNAGSFTGKSRIGLVLEIRVAIVELFTDCRNTENTLFLNGI